MTASGVYSQTVVVNPHDTVCLNTYITLETLRDLARYDSLKVVAALQESKVNDLQAAISNQVLQLKDCEASRDRLNLVINNYQALQTADKARASDLEKLYKKEVRAGRFKLVLIGGLVALTGYAFLK